MRQILSAADWEVMSQAQESEVTGDDNCHH